MSYNGSGTFNINSAGQPVVTGTVITSTAFNALTSDLATGLSTALTKDGQTTPTANIPMGTYKITGLGAGTVATDAVRLSQLQNGSTTTYITAAGTDTITGTVTPTLTAYATGQQFSFVVAATNTTAVTLNVDGVGAKAVTRTGSVALVAGDMIIGQVVIVEYDGTRFQLINGNSFTNLKASGTLGVTGVATLGNGAILGTPASGILTSCTGLNYDGFKSRLINGAMVIDQRNAGASVTGLSGGNYSLDRWNIFRTSGATGYTAQQQTSGTGNFTNAIRVQRTNANTSTESVILTQVVESNNCNNLSGLSVTLSFYARAGANYSATSSILSTRIVTGTTADQGIAGVFAGTWAGYTSTDQNNTLTTSFQKFTQTVTLGSGVQELAVWFKENPVGTAGANDWFEITGAQIEVGSTATSFDYRPYGTELALCQRYFTGLFSTGGNNPVFIGQAYSASNVRGNVFFPVTMRASPTVSVSAIGDFSSTNANETAQNVCTGSVSIVGTGVTTQAICLDFTSSGLAAGNACRLVMNSASGKLLFTSEL